MSRFTKVIDSKSFVGFTIAAFVAVTVFVAIPAMPHLEPVRQ